MSQPASQLTVPISEDAHGVLRVAGTRVTLDSVMSAWDQGATPEEIVLRFPTLDLADVYAVCAWALRHQDEVRDHLARREARGDALEAQATERFGLVGLRERLRARQG